MYEAAVAVKPSQSLGVSGDATPSIADYVAPSRRTQIILYVSSFLSTRVDE